MLCVSRAWKVRFYVIRNLCVRSSTYVLANIGNPLLDATGNVISAICHAFHNGWKIWFTVFWILTGATCKLTDRNYSVYGVIHEFYKTNKLPSFNRTNSRKILSVSWLKSIESKNEMIWNFVLKKSKNFDASDNFFQ